MYRILLSVLASILFLSCNSDKNSDPEVLSGQIEIKNKWMRPANADANSAGYLSIINGTAKTDTLLSVSSDAFEVAEVHESYETEAGLSGMRPAKNLDIAPGDSLVLKPGGLHLMLMSARQPITENDSITVNFNFKKAGERTVRIPVRSSN
ncbi:MAG: copper chaperone PCu(A)C [Balneolaceae bacterium]|nr:copper chaperone PCu(A)C [Balneolaceae bacterium]